MSRRRPTARVAALPIVALILACAGQVAASARFVAHGASAARGPSFNLVTVKCANPGYPKPVGRACATAAGYSPTEWMVSDGSATWSHPGQWKTDYQWSVPQIIGPKGADVAMTVTGNELTGNPGARICPAIGVQGQNVDVCAQSNSSASKSGKAHIGPMSGGSQTLIVGIQDGPTFLYTYEPGGSTTTTTTTAPSSSAGSCSGVTHGRRLQSARALKEVRVVCVEGDVQFHREGTPSDQWQTLEKDGVLKQGDEISCAPDGVAVLAFADNSTVTVQHTTQLKIASFFAEGGIVRTQILLKMGEVAATVNKTEVTKSDFTIQSPSFGGVRGAVLHRSAGTWSNVDSGAVQVLSKLSVFRDPSTNTEIWSVYKGEVDIRPTGGRPPVSLHPGQEVAITPSSVSKVAPIGKAGARGGINARAALDRVEKKIAAKQRLCALVTPRTGAFAVRQAANGWLVSVKAIAGKAKGSSTWRVAGAKVTPENALAKKIAAGCS